MLYVNGELCCFTTNICHSISPRSSRQSVSLYTNFDQICEAILMIKETLHACIAEMIEAWQEKMYVTVVS